MSPLQELCVEAEVLHRYTHWTGNYWSLEPLEPVALVHFREALCLLKQRGVSLQGASVHVSMGPGLCLKLPGVGVEFGNEGPVVFAFSREIKPGYWGFDGPCKALVDQVESLVVVRDVSSEEIQDALEHGARLREHLAGELGDMEVPIG